MSTVETRAADPIELARRNWVDAGWGDAADGMAFVTSLVRVQQLVLGRGQPGVVCLLLAPSHEAPKTIAEAQQLGVVGVVKVH